MLFNTRLSHSPTLRILSYNIKVKSKEEPCIGLTQENLIEFLVQYIYLIYVKQIVHTT